MAFTVNNTRIAKNTILLYLRTIFVMLISFYTSRVILRILGVDDFGIYQVVGGMVAIFSIISGSLSLSTSRYITFEIGTGNKERLRQVFSTSIIIQIVLAIIILLISEYPALWFVENKMNLPHDQITVTKWVFQFSLISFCINLVTIPYNACIIAHERMKAFAYISITEAAMKLGVCYLILVSPFGKLITYAALMMLTAIIIRIIYSVYCSRNFTECRGKISFDKKLFKEMMSFSGWSFFSNSASVLNMQGVTMLMNVYFGLALNTARGLATQIENSVLQFVNNFTTAVNPQITKSYASGEVQEMYKLVCRGAKFSSFAMFILAFPLIFEMKPVLRLWLGEIPDYTVIFSQLSLIMGVLDCMGSSGFTACMATGNLKKYAIVITSIGWSEFLGTWILYKYGAPAVSTYYLYIIVKIFINIARMYLLKTMVGLPIKMYLNNVFKPVILVAIISNILPFLIACCLEESVIRMLLTVTTAFISICLSVYYIGMTSSEQNILRLRIRSRINRIFN